MKKSKSISKGDETSSLGQPKMLVPVKIRIPDGWKIDFLDTLAKRGSGHTPNKNHSEYYNGGIKWVSLADSYRLDSGLINNTEIEISMQGIKNSSAVLHKAGTVLISRDAGVGKSAVMQEDMAVSQHFITWTCKESLDNWFLYYWLQLNKPFFERHAIGSTIKTIGLPLFKKLAIAHPQISEQKRISNLLGTWDKAINTLTQLIAQKEQRKKWLMQQLLTGKKRLKGFKGAWKEYHLGDFITESRIPSPDNDVNRRITVKLNLKGIEKRDVRGSEVEDATYFFVRRRGQFIYGKQNLHKGAFGIIPQELDGFESSQDIPAFDFKHGVNPMYFLLFLSQESFYQSLEKISTGTGSKRIHPENLYKVTVSFPSLAEQTAVAHVMQSADNELQLLKEKLKKLKEQKKGLMQVLLTGKKRLKK